MSKYFDSFIAEQIAQGEPVTIELLKVNQELKDKDRAKSKWKNRDWFCKLGLHSRVQLYSAGGIDKTCIKCWRHLL